MARSVIHWLVSAHFSKHHLKKSRVAFLCAASLVCLGINIKFVAVIGQAPSPVALVMTKLKSFALLQSALDAAAAKSFLRLVVPIDQQRSGVLYMTFCSEAHTPVQRSRSSL